MSGQHIMIHSSLEVYTSIALRYRLIVRYLWLKRRSKFRTSEHASRGARLRAARRCWNVTGTIAIPSTGLRTKRRTFVLCLSFPSSPVSRMSNFMEQTSSWEANSCSSSPEIPRLWWNVKVHCRLHQSLPLNLMPSQMNPIYSLFTFILFILILYSLLRLGLPMLSLPFRFSD
jgi:hypothetical protein